MSLRLCNDRWRLPDPPRKWHPGRQACTAGSRRIRLAPAARRVTEMIRSQTMQERNKALVLEAFNTLFNKRDYEAAERFWSPNYIQHSAHIAPGREGLFNLIKSMPPTLE